MSFDGGEAMREQQRRQSHEDRRHDETIEESFPASDPPAHTGITGTGSGYHEPPSDRRAPNDREDHERPTGTPTSDRHATETAFVWEHEEQPPAEQ
jgi:hypothetical protein